MLPVERQVGSPMFPTRVPTLAQTNPRSHSADSPLAVASAATIRALQHHGSTGLASSLLASLGQGRPPAYMLLYGAMIGFFRVLLHGHRVKHEGQTADNLKRHGGFIPGFRPGERTAEYIDYVLTRITVIGALYLIFVCLLPEFLIARTGVPFYLGGTSLLIVVSVTLDTVAQNSGTSDCPAI